MASVLEEHIEYLTLPGRNALYAEAIGHVVKSGDVVVDLGCGVGVLGLMCLKAGAARVYGIDHSDAIELARETVAKAGLTDRYHCLRGSTFQVELPEKADLIICDHIGFFGIDYGIVAMLEDARRRFLKPGGAVVPGALGLIVAGVGSAGCHEVADRWMLEPVPQEFHWLREYAVNTKHRHLFAADDICTDVADLGTIALDQDVAEALAFDCMLTAGSSGMFDGLACWFTANLAGEVWMTNSPLDANSIGRNQAFLPVREPFAVEPGDRIAVKVQIRHADDTITWTVTAPDGVRQRLSSWNSRILRAEDLRRDTGAPLALTPSGRATSTILGLVDGQRGLTEIEALALAANPPLMPTEAETRAMICQVLGKHTACQ